MENTKNNLRMQDVPMGGLGWRIQSQLQCLQANDQIAEQIFSVILNPSQKRQTFTSAV